MSKDNIRAELEALIDAGRALVNNATTPPSPPNRAALVAAYQPWYTKAASVVRQLLPERVDEFNRLYSQPQLKRTHVERVNYTISDYLQGVDLIEGSFSAVDVSDEQFTILFNIQLSIVRSALDRLDSLLNNLTGVLQAQLFDDELSAATHLRKNGHLRAAGIVAGVVLEDHLRQVAMNHSVAVKKKDPSIGDYNDALKSANVLNVPNWRFIQRLGDIRNLCGHYKGAEPTDQDVIDVIEGTDRTIKMIS